MCENLCEQGKHHIHISRRIWDKFYAKYFHLLRRNSLLWTRPESKYSCLHLCIYFCSRIIINLAQSYLICKSHRLYWRIVTPGEYTSFLLQVVICQFLSWIKHLLVREFKQSVIFMCMNKFPNNYFFLKYM